jgi:hypothetical protein
LAAGSISVIRSKQKTMTATLLGLLDAVNLYLLTTEAGSISEKPRCIQDNEKGPVHVSY